MSDNPILEEAANQIRDPDEAYASAIMLSPIARTDEDRKRLFNPEGAQLFLSPDQCMDTIEDALAQGVRYRPGIEHGIIDVYGPSTGPLLRPRGMRMADPNNPGQTRVVIRTTPIEDALTRHPELHAARTVFLSRASRSTAADYAVIVNHRG